MKKVFNSILCLALSLLMALTSASVAFAKEKVTPVILVHGLGANPVYENIGTEEQKEIKNLGLGDDLVSTLLDNEDLICEVLKIIEPKRKVNDKKLINSLAKLVKNTPINCTENGNVKKGQGIINYWTAPLSKHRSYYKDATVAESAIARQLCREVGAKNVYCFNYDWRQDICKTAKDLNAYIKKIKKKTGSKKVSLVGCSLGGAVLSAYMDAYKSKKDVKRYVFVNPAIMGVDVSRAYALDMKFSKKSIIQYLDCMESAYNNGSSAALFRLIYALGDDRIGYAADYLNGFVKNKKNVKSLFKKVIKPWIGNIPSLWECIPYNSFNKAVKEMSKMGVLDKTSGVYKKIKKYHAVQGRAKKNLKAVKKSGAQVAIIASYGTMGIPATSKAYNQTDVLIDTKYASAGATVAKYSKKLSKKNRKGKYVSPDKVINAKTCALPDNTWFLKDVQHMRFKYNSDATKLVARLATGKVKSNIYAVKRKYKIAQFTKENSDNKLVNV
ncbi:MAG: alpha/beta fold hydrolase [Eubacterium sp.]|nr:alpha/beta fold hydrolase [Eubacterium sp.]